MSEWGGGAEIDSTIDRLREFDKREVRRKWHNFADVIYASSLKEQDDGREELGNGVEGDRLVRNVLEVNMELCFLSPPLSLRPSCFAPLSLSPLFSTLSLTRRSFYRPCVSSPSLHLTLNLNLSQCVSIRSAGGEDEGRGPGAKAAE